MAAAVNKACSTDVSDVRAALSGAQGRDVYRAAEVRAADHQTARPIVMNQIVKGPDGKASYQIEKVFPGAELLPPVDPVFKM